MGVFDQHWYELEIQKLTKQWDREYQKQWFELPSGEVFGDPFEPFLDTAKLALRMIRDFAERVDHICRDIWRECVGAETPDFIRKELSPRVFNFISDREEKIRRDLPKMSWYATRNVEAALERFKREIADLKNELANDYEIKTRKLANRESSSTSTTPVVPPATSASRNWYDSDQDTLRRRQIILKNPRMPAKSLCNVFDKSVPPIPLPGDWHAELGVETWSEAYANKKSRNRIQKTISTDKHVGKQPRRF